MAEDEMERLVHRLDELEKNSNKQISDLQAKNDASEIKIAELERRLAQQSEHGPDSQEERTSLISAEDERSQANRSPLWRKIGDKDLHMACSDAFKQKPFKLDNDMCSVFCATSWKRLPFWLSILVVVGFQFSLFIMLLIDRVGSNRWVGLGSECYSDDAKACRNERPLDIPPNVEPLVRAAQAIALIIALYDQEDMRDGLEGYFAGMPVDYKGSSNFRKMTSARWNWSCFFRFLQGFLGLICAFVLLIQAETVFDVLLNFLGVKFISEMDDVAFHLALKGYFGNHLQEVAEDVDETYFRRVEDTRNWIHRNFHAIVMLFFLVVMIGWFAHLAILQGSGTFLIQNVYVDFGNDPFLSMFNGCYSASDDGVLNSRMTYSLVGTDAKIAFCRKADKNENGGWSLYMGSSPCPYDSSYGNGVSEVLAVSGPTRTFDFTLVDRNKWYRPYYFSQIENVRVHDKLFGACVGDSAATEMTSFLSNKCVAFNGTDPFWQEQKQFEMLVTVPSDEYPCRDPPTCHPIYTSNPEPYGDVDIIYYTGQVWVYLRAAEMGFEKDLYTGDLTKEDIRNYFYKGDGFKFETHFNSGTYARYVSTPWSDLSSSPFYVDWYEAAHEYMYYTNDKSEDVQFKIPYARLDRPVDFELKCLGHYVEDTECFREGWISAITPECICTHPIPDSVDLSSLRGKAIQEIKNDSQVKRLCTDLSSLATRERLLERYALAVIKNTFGIRSQGWEGNLCSSWLGDTVQLSCNNHSLVQELTFLDTDTVKHSGTIPAEILLLSHLEHLDMGQNDIRGQSPDEVGYLRRLTYLDLFDCNLSGTIPEGLGHSDYLETVYLAENKLTGTIPYSFGYNSKLELLSVYNNSLTGTIPEDIENLFNLTCFAQGNSITGTSRVCQLK